MHDAVWLIIRGVLSLVIGILAFLSPGVTLLLLVALCAAYAVLDGTVTLVLGFGRTPAHDRSWAQVLVGIISIREIAGEWLLALSGVMSIVFGIVVFAFPSAGVLTIAWLMGIYAAAWSIVLIGLGTRVRRPIVA